MLIEHMFDVKPPPQVRLSLVFDIVSLVRIWYRSDVKFKWQVQEAKAELSALLKAAQESPQIITRHGEPVAVVLSHDEYDKLRRRQNSRPLLSLLRSWPEFEIPERDRSDIGRDIPL
jgi:prevent-host-death family protein